MALINIEEIAKALGLSLAQLFMHAIPEAQKRAVDKVAEVLFTSVHNFSAATENRA
jgi:hypothetical protein